MNDDLLTRVFGPEPPNDNFKPLNPDKVIPFHECEYIETRLWTWTGMANVLQCPTCKRTPPPDIPEAA